MEAIGIGWVCDGFDQISQEEIFDRASRFVRRVDNAVPNADCAHCNVANRWSGDGRYLVVSSGEAAGPVLVA